VRMQTRRKTGLAIVSDGGFKLVWASTAPVENLLGSKMIKRRPKRRLGLGLSKRESAPDARIEGAPEVIDSAVLQSFGATKQLVSALPVEM
jgi:hypothetical protein